MKKRKNIHYSRKLEAKGRKTVKILNEKFYKEITHLKETVRLLETILENSETIMKSLEEKSSKEKVWSKIKNNALNAVKNLSTNKN